TSPSASGGRLPRWCAVDQARPVSPRQISFRSAYSPPWFRRPPRGLPQKHRVILRSGDRLIDHRITRSRNHPITSIPMERAVPATDLIADSSVSQFRSGSLVLAISSTCFLVTVPTLVLFGSADPLARFAARFSSTDAGGVLVMKE